MIIIFLTFPNVSHRNVENSGKFLYADNKMSHILPVDVFLIDTAIYLLNYTD